MPSFTIYENRQPKNEPKDMVEDKPRDFEQPKVDDHADDKDGISVFTQEFLSLFEEKLSQDSEKSTQVIRVSEVLGKLARLYERIRTTVEYKGEHVLRRNAIERILKRLVWEQESVKNDIDNRRVAETLIKELIWARYIPNGALLQTKIDEIEKIVNKYVYFLRNLDNLPQQVSVSKVRAWMWGVASSEIEDMLDPSYREIFVKLMYDWFEAFFSWEDSSVDAHQKAIQTYLAIHRAFTKSDEAILRYHLLLKEFPHFRQADQTQINKLILGFPKVYSEIEDHLNYPGRMSLYRLVQKNSAAFDIFHEIANEEKSTLKELLRDKKKFEEKVRQVCSLKYKQIKERVSTGIVRSIIYIFLTKMLFAMIIEIPYEVVFLGDVRYLPLSINLIIPPIMMWIIGLSIRVPGARNTEAIIDRLRSVVYASHVNVKQNFSLQKSNKNTTLTSLFGIVYTLIFLLVFGSITYFLTLLNFTLFGIVIFFAFLSLVLLFAYRVRYNANQLKIEAESESLLGHLTSYFTLPLLNFGFYLSRGLSKLNFLTIILDFLIEVPLKNMIEIFEEWTSFIREKKEEVVEIPE